MLTRRNAVLSLLGSATAALPAWPRRPRAPNIVLLLADDLGYGETGCFGSKDIPTPHIDSLARGGVRFTGGYVSCPLCSPTRAGLMTGRYQQRFGHEFNPGHAPKVEPNFGLPPTESTIADRLKSAGYVTGIFGKWHLGYRPESQPQKHGFDEFFGFLGGSHSYLDAAADPADLILRGTQPVGSITYTTDEFAREAAAFIERHRRNPFFLYLPFNAVHAPLETIEKYRARFKSIQDPKRRAFAAVLSAMDDGIGRVLGTLRTHKLEQDTLIFFLSDNGGPTSQSSSGNGPLRGSKGEVWEGGIRVPFLMQWKNHLPAGQVYSQPVIALDILPTAVAAAGGVMPPEARLDGVNLLPHLTGKLSGPPHEALFWRFGSQAAVRVGDWKLVLIGGEAPALFNLAEDIGETKDLASRAPERVKQIKATYDAWNAQLMEPRWGRGARPAGKQQQK